jgi:hypothetical protein
MILGGSFGDLYLQLSLLLSVEECAPDSEIFLHRSLSRCITKFKDQSRFYFLDDTNHLALQSLCLKVFPFQDCRLRLSTMSLYNLLTHKFLNSHDFPQSFYYMSALGLSRYFYKCSYQPLCKISSRNSVLHGGRKRVLVCPKTNTQLQVPLSSYVDAMRAFSHTNGGLYEVIFNLSGFADSEIEEFSNSSFHYCTLLPHDIEEYMGSIDILVSPLSGFVGICYALNLVKSIICLNVVDSQGLNVYATGYRGNPKSTDQKRLFRDACFDGKYFTLEVDHKLQGLTAMLSDCFLKTEEGQGRFRE